MDRESVVVLSWFGFGVILLVGVMLWRRIASMWSFAVVLFLSGILIVYAGLVEKMDVTLLGLVAIVVNVAMFLFVRLSKWDEKGRKQ